MFRRLGQSPAPWIGGGILLIAQLSPCSHTDGRRVLIVFDVHRAACMMDHQRISIGSRAGPLVDF